MVGLRRRPGAATRRPAVWTPELAAKVEWRRRAAGEPFRGVAGPGGVRSGLFPLGGTGVDVGGMRRAAGDYLAALSAPELAAGLFPMDHESWRHWANGARYFLRHGLCLEDLDATRRRLALAVLARTLSGSGYRQVVDLMHLNRTVGELRGEEDLLNEWLYWFSLYGEPRGDRPWGWQLDGHHVNVNCVVVGDQLTLTPTFLGAEPVVADAGRYAGTAAFRREESVGQRLFGGLTGRQRRRAVIADELPPDLFTGAFRDNVELDQQGLPLADLAPAQRAVADELIGLYVNRVDDGHARVRLAEVEAYAGETYLAWIGDPDGVFYYRVHSPVLLVEFEHQAGVMFDNDVPSRRHIHTMVRTPNGNDYGLDLLRQHHERFHRRGDHEGSTT